MSQQNLVSVSITDEDMTEIKGAIETLKKKLLPHLKSLKPEDRRDLPKMGDKSVAFVQKALEHCKQNPELVPQFLDIDEFANDTATVEKLRSMSAPIAQISESLSDTMIMS